MEATFLIFTYKSNHFREKSSLFAYSIKSPYAELKKKKKKKGKNAQVNKILSSLPPPKIHQIQNRFADIAIKPFPKT